MEVDAIGASMGTGSEGAGSTGTRTSASPGSSTRYIADGPSGFMSPRDDDRDGGRELFFASCAAVGVAVGVAMNRLDMRRGGRLNRVARGRESGEGWDEEVIS